MWIQKRHLLLLVILQALLISFSPWVNAQNKIPASFCISPAERAFADSINSLRVKQGKKPLQLSVSLSFVAKTHALDLSINHPDTNFCNLSSWSDKGKWTACCYNPYVTDHDAMWKKPQELTSYRYRGYEMVAYMQDPLVPDSVLHFWKTNHLALDMILTEGVYKDKNWLCMGVGISDHYASVWFGQRKDVAGTVKICAKRKAVSQLSKHAANNVSKGASSYYLIIGNFPNMKDAKEALVRFRKEGFKHAGILRKGNLIRIYLNHYPGYSSAIKARQKLPYSYRKAWILRQ